MTDIQRIKEGLEHARMCGALSQLRSKPLIAEIRDDIQKGLYTFEELGTSRKELEKLDIEMARVLNL